jgi:3-oxoacyl-[acyl-carrier protein] reductase
LLERLGLGGHAVRGAAVGAESVTLFAGHLEGLGDLLEKPCHGQVVSAPRGRRWAHAEVIVQDGTLGRMGRLDGRVAFLTGAGRGIGAATAAKLAAEGAAVAVTDMDIDPAEETAGAIRSAGGRALAIAVDVTNREQVEAACARAAQEFGHLDILIALAGITRDNLLFKMSDEDWDGVINTHLKGSFIAARAAQKYMVEQRYGKMIFTSSTSALGNRGQSNYSTAKAGLQGLARTLSIELGPFNINVNAVAPGFIETRMTQQTAERMGADWEQFKKNAAAQTPVRRTGTPEDVANVIAFLVSDEASFVSGQILYVAGGPRG